MELKTIITAVFVLVIVWGGFSFFLLRAVRFEKMKKDDPKPEQVDDLNNSGNSNG